MKQNVLKTVLVCGIISVLAAGTAQSEGLSQERCKSSFKAGAKILGTIAHAKCTGLTKSKARDLAEAVQSAQDIKFHREDFDNFVQSYDQMAGLCGGAKKILVLADAADISAEAFGFNTSDNERLLAIFTSQFEADMNASCVPPNK